MGATMAPHPEAGPHKRSGPERRQHPRASCELPITLLIEGASHQAMLRDISRAGVCFYLERPIPPMTVLGLVLDLVVDGKPRKIRGQGAVVRCEKISPALKHYEIALFLHDLSDSDRALIDAHVKQGAPA